MRLLIALLVVVNALLLAVQQGVISLPSPTPPGPVPQPLRAEALHLLHRSVTEYRPEAPAADSPLVAATSATETPAPRSSELLSPAPPSSPPASAELPQPPAPQPEVRALLSATATPAEPTPATTPAPSATPVVAPPPAQATPSQTPAALSQAPIVSPHAPPTSMGTSETASPPPAPTAAPEPLRQPPAEGLSPRCVVAEVPAETEPIVRELARALPALKAASKTLPSRVEAWWVATPPQRNEAAARVLADSFKQKGIDWFLIRDPGPDQWRISLGLFRSRERAELLRSQLQAKGVTAVEILPRQKPPRVQLTVTGSNEAVERFLGRSKARLPAVSWEACHR